MLHLIPNDEQEAAYLAAVAAHNAATYPTERERHKAAGYTVADEVKRTCGDVAVGMLVMAGDMSLPDDGRPACGGFYLDLT